MDFREGGGEAEREGEERGREREKKRETINMKEKHLSERIKPTTFWCMGQCSNQLSHLARVRIFSMRL